MGQREINFLKALSEGEKDSELAAAAAAAAHNSEVTVPTPEKIALLEESEAKKAAEAAERERIKKIHEEALKHKLQDEADGEYSDGGKQIGEEWKKHNNR